MRSDEREVGLGSNLIIIFIIKFNMNSNLIRTKIVAIIDIFCVPFVRTQLDHL
jgi:hypothetical protein